MIFKPAGRSWTTRGVSWQCNSCRNSQFEQTFLSTDIRLCRLVPIEIVIVIAINLVVVVAGYCTVMMWGLFSG
jgi:hypothetical protein